MSCTPDATIITSIFAPGRSLPLPVQQTSHRAWSSWTEISKLIRIYQIISPAPYIYPNLTGGKEVKFTPNYGMDYDLFPTVDPLHIFWPIDPFKCCKNVRKTS